jgi:hypothetical protein
MAKTSKKTAGQANKALRLRNRFLALTALTVFAVPAAAESAFEKLYPASQGQLNLPTPFSALLDDIRQKTGNAEIRTAFIPLGRSLQRLAADPDFFAKPRIVAAITGDGANPVTFRNRLYLGYQEASGSIEIIAFDEVEGRFVFQEVTGYEAGKPATFQRLEDQGCAACHQSNLPIFAASPWSESNANPAVVAALGENFQGLNIKQDFDGIDQLDRSIRRAARLQTAAKLWLEGCQSRVCRGALLAEVLRYKLAPQPLAYEVKDTSFMTELTASMPGGFALAPVKIPDHDPMSLVAAGAAPASAIGTTGVFNPETARAEQIFWPAGPEGPRAAVQLVSELIGPRETTALAQQLPPDDPDWLAARVRKVAEGTNRVVMFDGALPTPSSLEALAAQVLAGRPKSGDEPQ